MAGRGRGKSSMSFTTEQLGFAKGEGLPPPVLHPPQNFPLLEHRPVSPSVPNEMDYLTELKRCFAEYTRESPYYMQPKVPKKDIERYSDRYQDVTDESVYDFKFNSRWTPVELKSSRKRKIQMVTQPSKRRKLMDIETKLEELEKKENKQSGVEEEVKEEEDADELNELDADDEEVVDEEMDDGTDYLNNYFDNGEGYDDEEENLDDGPVY